jgi:hypothetical protein
VKTSCVILGAKRLAPCAGDLLHFHLKEGRSLLKGFNYQEGTSCGLFDVGFQFKRLRLVSQTARLRLMFLALAIVMGCTLLHAQGSWQVDPQHSVATFSVGSGQKSVELGMARVHGFVVFDPESPTNAPMHLIIAAEKSNAADYARIIFTSQKSFVTPDGRLAESGTRTSSES